MYDVIVIGGGPAALGAAFYAQDKQLSVALIFEELGGKPSWNEPGARRDWEPAPPGSLPANDHVRLLRSHTLAHVDIVNEPVVRITPNDHLWRVETGPGSVWTGRTVIVATGASPVRLRVPGAQQWLDQVRGTYSLTTFAHEVAGQRVAVIGTTRRGLIGVTELVKTAAQVYLLHPDPAQLATPLGHALRRQFNVELVPDAQVTEVRGTEHGTELILTTTGRHRCLQVQRVFVDGGVVPNSALIRGVAATDRDGFILVDPAGATSAPGLFAAGDVTVMPGEQVFAAMGDGARAAVSAYRYLVLQRVGSTAPIHAA